MIVRGQSVPPFVAEWGLIRSIPRRDWRPENCWLLLSNVDVEVPLLGYHFDLVLRSLRRDPALTTLWECTRLERRGSRQSIAVFKAKTEESMHHRQHRA